MKTLYLHFLRNLLIFAAVLGFLLWGVSFLIPSRFLSPTLPYQFAFFIGLTYLVGYILILSSQKKFAKFLNAYLLVTTVKLLFFLVVILVYVFLNRSDAAPFAISFFILYLFFSTFEVVSLVLYSKELKQ